jgi:hypothetical protein
MPTAFATMFSLIKHAPAYPLPIRFSLSCIVLISIVYVLPIRFLRWKRYMRWSIAPNWRASVKMLIPN